MVSLAGALTTISTTIHPALLPTYDHENLSICFTDLETSSGCCRNSVPSNCVSLPLKLVQPSIYATAIEQDQYFRAPQIYPREHRLEPGRALRKTPSHFKVGSHDIDHHDSQALPGLRASPTWRIRPSAMPLRS